MPNPRHNPFCARCGITSLLHAYPETSCEKYIAPGSREAKELKSGIPPVCGRCGGRTDGAKTTPSMGGMRIAACDCSELESTKAESIVIDSGVIDNRLVVATNEWLQAKIAKATLHLQVGLSMPKDHPSREKQFDRALKALGGLGAA